MPVERRAGRTSYGHVKPVGKERLILRVGFKSFLFPQVHSGCCVGGWIGEEQGKARRGWQEDVLGSLDEVLGLKVVGEHA